MPYKINKTLHEFDGFIVDISTPHVIKKDAKFPVKRAIITFSTKDEQTMFLEVRGKVVDRVQNIGLSAGDRVKVGVLFAGSKKGDNTFNNIFCNAIDYVG